MNYLSKHPAVSPAVQDGDTGSVEHEGEVNGGAESGAGAPIVRVGVYSLVVNVVLVAGKLALSLATGSLALRADAIHSLVDVFASIALILGLIISGRKSRDFPYGLYKVENLVSTLISLLLFLAAYELLREAIGGRTSTTTYGAWVPGVVAIFVLIPLLFGRYELKIGRRYRSPGLIADGSQFRADVFGSSVVFIGVLGRMLGLPLDRVAAGVVVLLIGYAAWNLLVSSMRVLLDASASPELLGRARALIMAEPMVGEIRSLVGRNSGRYVFIETVITVRTGDLSKAHALSERIERAVKGGVPNVDRVLVHCEPEAKTQLRYAVPLADRAGRLNEDFGKSPYFALIDIDRASGAEVKHQVIANPYRELEKGRGIKVAELLKVYKPDVVIAREGLVGKGPGFALSDWGVEVRQTEARSLDELLHELTQGE